MKDIKNKYIRLKEKIFEYNNWQEEYKCHYCNKRLKFEETNLDHIVPLGLLNQLGLNVNSTATYNSKYHKIQWDNLQIVCRRCNMLKSCKIDWVHPKTEILLAKFIQSAKEERDEQLFVLDINHEEQNY